MNLFDSFFNLPWVNKVIICLVTFFTPIYPAMIAVGLLIVIDTILGVIAAKKQGVKLSSKAFGRVITKMLVYQLLVIASYLAETYLFGQVPFLNITLGFLAVTEFVSVAENMSKITGTNFIGYLREQLDTKFRGMIKVENKDNTPTS